MTTDERKTKTELLQEIKVLKKRIAELEVENLKFTMKDVTALDDLRGEETILVVDDNDLFRKFIVNTLNLLGYHTFDAENASSALKIIEDNNNCIDLIVTDIVMPDMSGRELASHLKPYKPKIKIIFMSGYAEDVVVHKEVYSVMHDGASFLKKPFSPMELAEKIKRALTGRA